MAVDLDDLERLARAATPGPWRDTSEGSSWTNGEITGADNSSVADVDGTSAEYEANAAFIAAANPSTILALVAELKAAREVAEVADEAMGHERWCRGCAEAACSDCTDGCRRADFEAALTRWRETRSK